MARPLAALFASRSRWFDLGVLLSGVFVVVWSTVRLVQDGVQMNALALVCIPLIVIIAKFPMVLDSGEGGIEVGFDSSVLMFLLCTLKSPYEAVVIWALGVLVTQMTTDKRQAVKLFNLGVGFLGGGVAAAVVFQVRGPQGEDTFRELVAVALAAACYFATDYLTSAVSVAIETDTPVRGHLVQRGTLFAIACFVPFDSLGYLGAVVARHLELYTLLLLAVPLVTLLVATRAVNRGRENARRLSVLFDAAVRAQTLSDTRQVVDALTDDARRLLRIGQVEVRSTPPGAHEIGAQLRDGQRDSWIVAPGQHRARSTTTADQQALEAMVAVSSDAFARLRLTEDMTHLARHDLLTNLPNRGLLLDRVEHALQMSRRRGNRIALLFVDLDGFKPVNDRFGHAAGDAVLIDVAQRLRECVRQSDTVARLGGDEFALLLEDVNPPEVSTACDRILTSLSRGAHVAGHQLALSASIGVAFGDSSETAESMLRNADLAMYEAKARGKNQWVEYERAIGRSRLQRLELVESLRASVAAGDLTLVYQPVVRASTGYITGVEALARWKSNGVDVPPDVFIRVAEETGLVVALGDVVLDQAARDAAVISRAAGGDFNVSVNISAKQLREPDFVTKVERAMAKMDGATLVLEITERDGIGTDPASMSAMSTLADRGVPFAIDDFGVGFSSIGYLQDMPVRIIKTDLSFSESIDRDERSCALLCSITMMGQALGLDVVVEGIERASQLDHLRDHVHAPFAQGYLMHRPMPLDQLVKVIAENRALPAIPQRDPARVSPSV
ncbi:EAL domain-containing protein [Nocardioides panacis]|uniref:EAL domain-containing protein n=2 Tax=Nocardioides panacis TaxID=2849501 RepID=A0A975T2C9_9ACTN|nr:EAL domain-containing protein [Nocardioides panacis]QWZ09603.1 EAL domain-containing protein [Nocardioides panacis]